MRYGVITYTNSPTRLDLLKKGEKLFNYNINYIINDSWNTYRFYSKIRETALYIENLNDDDIIVFIDAHDVVLNSNKEEFVKKFKSLNCDILFSSELICYPTRYKEKMDDIMPSHLESKYLNAGGYMGYVKSIKEMFKWKTEEQINLMCKHGGDQAYFMEYFINNYDKVNIKLDIHSTIFQSMIRIPWEHIEFKNGRGYNKNNDSYPCFFHFNGGSCRGINKNKCAINIMPTFYDLMEQSKKDNKVYDLSNYKKGFKN